MGKKFNWGGEYPERVKSSLGHPVEIEDFLLSRYIDLKHAAQSVRQAMKDDPGTALYALLTVLYLLEVTEEVIEEVENGPDQSDNNS